MKTIFAPGAYMWENKGDAALVLAFIPWLRDAIGAEDITLTSFKPESDAKRYGVPVLPMVTRPFTFAKRAAARASASIPGARVLLVWWRVATIGLVMVGLRIWTRIYRKSRPVAKRLVPRHIFSIAEAISGSDAVVTVPGGYLLAARETDDWWLYHLPTLKLAHLLGKTVVLGPCSVGPFVGVHREIARKALSNVHTLVLRENRSAALVAELGVDASKVILSPDMAFRFQREGDSQAGRAFIETLPAGRKLLGISVREHHFPGYRDPASMLDRYLDAVREAVIAIEESTPVLAVVVPQTTMDAAISERFGEMLRTAGCEFVLAGSGYSPGDLQTIYSEFDMVIGTRMHANILAMCVGTPVVGIAYEPKTLGILEDLGLGEWGIKIDEVGEGRLRALAMRQWSSATQLGQIALERTSEARGRLDEVGRVIVERVMKQSIR